MSEGRSPSERPPAGWDPQAVASAPESAPAPFDDDILAAHLRRRATHRELPRAFATAVVTRVAETEPERRWRLVVAAWRPRIAVAVSGLTLVLLAGLLYVGGSPPRNGGPPTTPPTLGTTPSAAPVGVTWDPTVRPMTPPDLLRFLATSPAPGTVLIVDDQIVPLLITCAAAERCPSGELRNAQGVRIEAPPGGHLPYLIDPTIATTSITGPLALEVSSGPNLVFMGAVVGNGLRMAFTAKDLAQRSAMGGLFVIPAWIHQTGPRPCPSIAVSEAPLPTSELGLPAPNLDSCNEIYLTDADPGPWPYPGPRDPLAFRVQTSRYPATPAAVGSTRQGVFLVRDWAGYGEVLAQLEPLFIPSDEASGPTSEPTAGPTVGPSPSTAGGIVMSVDELLRRVQDHSLKAGSIGIAVIPVQAVSQRWAPGAVHSCPQLCPKWHLFSGTRSTDVVVSMEAPAPQSIVGVQAFLVLDDGTLQALGPVATGPTGEPLDGSAVVPIVNGLSVVHGWLRLGPPLLCPQRPAPLETGILGEPLSWSQCPGTWVLPSADDPWAGPPSSAPASGGPIEIGIGDLSVPAGTLHVQDRGGLATLDPVEGTWLLRAAVSNACPSWARCPAAGNATDPQPGVTWYELVDAIIVPAPATPVPEPSSSASSSPVVLSQERLVADVRSGAIQPGSIVIANATIAPVILPRFPPDPGTVAGKIGPIRVHWASDPSLDATDLHQVALRVRPDGELDYLGPVDISQVSGASGGSSGLDGSTNRLFLSQTWHGPMLLRRIDCDAPETIKLCPIGHADAQTVNLGPVFVAAP